ncbi:MAG: VWA domain-containing protein, partial [Clostridia bacterium]|nr:VWA domain-containing protein [Clostridia bacterium]
YPEISLFLKVVDEYGNPIENLEAKDFIVREYMDIDDYLERDVIYAAKVEGNATLNVSLALDRSSSLNNTDMRKIKDATNTFLSKIQFETGDKAEIVGFDTNVMQMCMFTDNRDNLINGVNSMHPYGLTACYDAIIRSIQNASAQNGARCVIVFTDGDDTKSRSNVDDVIKLAKEKSVPVYTIGVGSQLKEDRLRRIANETGGTYHHIDDISAMSRVYDEIYKEQKNMYQVKYISDVSISQDAERGIFVTVSGDGYKGYFDRTYTPVVPVLQQQHTSRYEVIKADITWEDANRICIEKGGHLATIANREEEEKIIAVAESSGVERLWIGGYTTNDQNNQAVGHWVMGEPFVYQNWYNEGEPSRFDSDSAEEFYLMLWKIEDRWSWNDQRNDLINSPFRTTYEGKMGYVIEYEN